MTPTMIILGTGDIGGVDCNINYTVAWCPMFPTINRSTFIYKLCGEVLNSLKLRTRFLRLGAKRRGRPSFVKIMWISGSNNDQLGDTQAVLEAQ
jgi:hypothetical protein